MPGPHGLPASALDRWPGVFPNGVFIHLYLSEQHSCWTRVKIEYSPISNFAQNLNVPINPSSKCLFYKFSRNMWTHKDSVRQGSNSLLLKHPKTKSTLSKILNTVSALKCFAQKPLALVPQTWAPRAAAPPRGRAEHHAASAASTQRGRGAATSSQGRTTGCL